MKIAFFETKPIEKQYLQTHLSLRGGRQGGRRGNLFVEFFKETLNKDWALKTDFDAVSVFVNSKVDKQTLAKFKKLKFIATRSTGFDHIDLAACKRQKVAVANVPYYGENTVAEFAFALILNLARKIYDSYDQIRETGSFSLENLRGFDLKGRTLGVVGTGHIGRHVIRYAKAFGMKVLAFDKYPDNEFANQEGFVYAKLNDVLKKSDIVTLHVPYLPSTHHLINKKTIALMKKGAYLINTSRGAVVETAALVGALQKKHLGGAGLDVLEEEDVIKDEIGFFYKGHPREHDLKTILANHILIDMPNVIITPHNAFNTTEALHRILDTTVENIKGFAEGNVKNQVN